jgi:hypothetical protein
MISIIVSKQSNYFGFCQAMNILLIKLINQIQFVEIS